MNYGKHKVEHILQKTPFPQILGSAADVAGGRAVTGTVAETELYNLSIPAGIMGPYGALRISGWNSHTNDASNKTLRIKFGSLILTHIPSTNTSEQWTIWIRNTSTASQRCHASIASSQGPTGTAVVTGSVDTSLVVPLQITGQLSDSLDTLVLEGVTVELIQTL